MGGVSSCCSTEPAESKEAISVAADASAAKKGHNTDRGSEHFAGPPCPPVATHARVSDRDAFQRRLEQGIEVIVLLADGTRLTCDLKLSTADKALIISCDTNVREIPLRDLKAILHGKDQLRRVETKAPLTEDANCVALHMVTGNCIPIRFEIQDDKNAFIELIRKLK